jgi:hypothetical protein
VGKERQLVVHLVLQMMITLKKAFSSRVVVVGTIGKLCREQQSVVHLTDFVIV